MSVRRIIRELLSFATIVLTAGVWDGAKEATAVVSAPATDDAQAHHVAALISARTGNVCVLVVRIATADDAPTYLPRNPRIRDYGRPHPVRQRHRKRGVSLRLRSAWPICRVACFAARDRGDLSK